MAERYFVFLGSEDGGCYVREMNRGQLLEALELEPGERTGYLKGFALRKILTALPDDMCNFSDAVIIKGEIVVPRPVQQVTRYELP